MLNAVHHGENLTARAETFTPKGFKFGVSPSMAWLMAVVLMVLGLLPLRAQTRQVPDPGVQGLITLSGQVGPLGDHLGDPPVRASDRRNIEVFDPEGNLWIATDDPFVTDAGNVLIVRDPYQIRGNSR